MSNNRGPKFWLILWDKNGKCIVWQGTVNKKEQSKKEPFTWTHSNKPFYFYLDDFKTVHIEDTLKYHKRKNKIKYINLTKYKQKELESKLNELEEANLFQRTLLLKLKSQYLLLNSSKEEKIMIDWNLRAEDAEKNINKFVKKNITSLKYIKVKTLYSKIKPFRKKFLTFRKSIIDLNQEIDDLLEKTDDFLNKPNNFQEDLLKEKYEDLKQKNLVLESDYAALRIEFKYVSQKLSKVKWEINNKLKKNPKQDEKNPNAKILKAKAELQALNSTIHNKNVKILNLEEELNQTNETIAVATTNDKNKDAEILKLREELEQEKLVKNKLTLELQAAYDIIKDKDNEITKLQEQSNLIPISNADVNSFLNSTFDDLFSTESNLNSQLARLNNIIKDKDNEILKLKDELDKNKKIKSLTQSLNVLDSKTLNNVGEQVVSPSKKQKTAHNNLSPLFNLPTSSNYQEISWTDYDNTLIDQFLDLLGSCNESNPFLLNQEIDDLNLEVE